MDEMVRYERTLPNPYEMPLRPPLFGVKQSFSGDCFTARDAVYASRGNLIYEI
jgi:hypothetical protein